MAKHVAKRASKKNQLLEEDFVQEDEEEGGGIPKGCACGCMVLVALLLAAILAAAIGWLYIKSDIEGDASLTDIVTITVEQGSSSSTIADLLSEAGLVNVPLAFRYYVSSTGVGSSLQYGDFEIPEGASYDEMIEILSKHVAAATTRVTFPEGSTAISIANKMEEAGLCTAEEFLEVANTGDFSQFNFWSHIPTDEEEPDRFMKCEGYLFPETYDFYDDDTVYNYVATFYAEFDSRITDDLIIELESQGMTLQEIIVLASLVQEEAGNENDEKVSAVFRNRLADGSPYPLLQSNASSYIQNENENNYVYNWIAPYYGGWDSIPENILTAYDTYSSIGLPPGPISNPGYDAILAAIYPDPDMDGYYFFVTDLTGVYYYGKTLAEHNANCDKAWAVNATL